MISGGVERTYWGGSKEDLSISHDYEKERPKLIITLSNAKIIKVIFQPDTQYNNCALDLFKMACMVDDTNHNLYWIRGSGIIFNINQVVSMAVVPAKVNSHK